MQSLPNIEQVLRPTGFWQKRILELVVFSGYQHPCLNFHLCLLSEELGSRLKAWAPNALVVIGERPRFAVHSGVQFKHVLVCCWSNGFGPPGNCCLFVSAQRGSSPSEQRHNKHSKRDESAARTQPGRLRRRRAHGGHHGDEWGRKQLHHSGRCRSEPRAALSTHAPSGNQDKPTPAQGVRVPL